jgi:hypothetical protein
MEFITIPGRMTGKEFSEDAERRAAGPSAAKSGESFPWDGADQSLRQILDRMVQTKEAWAAALTGGNSSQMDDAPPAGPTPAAMPARLDDADARSTAYSRSAACSLTSLRSMPTAVCSRWTRCGTSE